MPPNASTNMNELLLLLRQDEATALRAYREVYNRYAPKILRATLKFLRKDELAEDLVQEVFLMVWQKRDQLQHVENFELYLYGIVKRQAARIITNKLRFDAARIEFSERNMSSEGEDERQIYRAALDQMLEELPEQRRTIFRLAKFEGMSYEAIAKHLNISIHTVNHNITQALKFMDGRKRDLLSLLIASSVFSG